MVLLIGSDNWPFPIPLVQHQGQWHYDLAAGKEEIINRRIGGNELAAIDFCHQYVQAQQAYYAMDRDGDGFQEYARSFVSAPGKKNGLFWFRRPGEDLSPLGPIAVQAFAEGYLRNMNGTPQPYHGYYFRILTAQGPHAPGRIKNYIGIGGRMTEGFAMIAYPARWGVSGVMTFMVNQENQVWEKDLGPNTPARASSLSSYDPDPQWRSAESQ